MGSELCSIFVDLITGSCCLSLSLHQQTANLTISFYYKEACLERSHTNKTYWNSERGGRGYAVHIQPANICKKKCKVLWQEIFTKMLIAFRLFTAPCFRYSCKPVTTRPEKRKTLRGCESRKKVKMTAWLTTDFKDDKHWADEL